VLLFLARAAGGVLEIREKCGRGGNAVRLNMPVGV